MIFIENSKTIKPLNIKIIIDNMGSGDNLDKIYETNQENKSTLRNRMLIK